MSLREPADYAAVRDYLFGLKPQGAKFGIDRMRLLAAALGHPERGLPVVHVAGTNGKGSVAAMLEAILTAAGWRCGLYTSPHLVHLGERVQVARQRLADDKIIAYVEELRPVAERIEAAGGADDRPSFFEYVTAMAFMEFRRQKCDIAVIETGLGGRLDATNIVNPEVAVITSIGLDHCEYLGRTVEQIAAEKAGVIKPGRPIVLGRMPVEAERVVREIAVARGTPVTTVAAEFGLEVERCPHPNLEGDYQRWNAATATLAARALGVQWRITDDVIARGLQRVTWPGRWQRTQLGDRLLVLDSSHNPEGAEALEGNLARLVRETGQAPVVMVGVLGSERALPLLKTIARHAREIHLVVPQQPRACSHGELEALVPRDFRGRVVRATVEGLFPSPGNCTAGGPDDVLVLTGSIYLLGEVMTRLETRSG